MRRSFRIAALCSGVLLAGCTNPYSPGQRAAGGALIGAGGGAAIGALAGGGQGAAIGAVAGGLTGAAVGAVTTRQRSGYHRGGPPGHRRNHHRGW